MEMDLQLTVQDSAGDDLKLLTVYHNSSGNDDAINYYGRTDNDNNIANLGWVKNLDR